MTEKDDLFFLEHILESIKDIESFTNHILKEDLNKNKEKLNAIIRSVEVIGEAVRNISFSLKEQNSEIPWKKIIGTRDMLIHHYFGIDVEALWKIINEDIPELKIQIIKIKEYLMK
jgi:uncharacterized protein with HEPN domain